MTMFGLQTAEIRPAVELVTNERSTCDGETQRQTDGSIAERFARAAWAGIAEPGDGDAGHLIARVGASTALRGVLEKWSAADVVDRMRERGSDDAESRMSRWKVALERWQPRLKSEPVLRSMRQAARLGASLVVPGDADWPSRLDDLGDHGPIALWVRGRTESLTRLSRSISLVGARASTGYGDHVAMEATAGLVDRGFSIVSGAAYGIDGAAHRAALASEGTTFAFLAGGVDRFYPSAHDELLSRIVEAGAVFSELPCGAAPTRWRFLQRNRLIAAVSRGTIVIEAGSRSGSLNTAAHAASLGRPVGAVPGPVTSPSSAGCHELLRGFDAVCVTNAHQMANLIGEPDPGEGSNPYLAARRTSEQTRVLDALSRRSARAADDIAVRCGMSVSAVTSALGALLLDGVVRENQRGWLNCVDKKEERHPEPLADRPRHDLR